MIEETIECDAVVIGAGVVGLAIAARLSQSMNIVVLETYDKFGQETSSRNSEVIHSGIYYPIDSKKTNFCIRGRELLYDFASKKGVPFQRCGKFVVACEPSEVSYLEKLRDHCKKVGVPVESRTGALVAKEEPQIRVLEALYLPETGIVDSHQLMQSFENEVNQNGSFIAYRNRFVRASKNGREWGVEVLGPDSSLRLKAAWVINAAGLSAATISNHVLSTRRYEHRFCRGRYFSLKSKYQGVFKHLIYPVPPKDGLGVHITIDLTGQARLGPDVDWCADSDYSTVSKYYDCDWETIRPSFVSASFRYCPQVEPSDLLPGLIGIRPKLFIDGMAHPDFLIENHEGFIHCLGIESPGLTSSLAIAEELSRLTQ